MASPAPHTPDEIAKDLGRSAGAVGNALTTLAGRAEAERLPGKPIRYQANSATAAVAAITPRAPAPPRPVAPAAPVPAAAPQPAVPQAPAPGPVTRLDGQVYRPRVLADMPDVEYEDFTRAVNALDGALGLSRPGRRASW